MRYIFNNKERYDQLPEPISGLLIPFKDRQKDIVLLSVITSMSSIIPNVWTIYGGKKYYSNLNCMIVGPPATGKGKMTLSKELVNPIHKKVIESSEGGNPQLKEIKLLPGNTTSAMIYSHLEKSEHGMLMIESETDTLSQMLRSEHGQFSDVLRKTAEHEDLSYSRKTDSEFYEIIEPKLSVLLSGTLNQMSPFFGNISNGLFSRFLVYSYDDSPSFVNPLLLKEDLSEIFKKCGTDFALPLYNRLYKNDGIKFELTENQIKWFGSKGKRLSAIFSDPLERAELYRGLVSVIRIAMLLSVFRNAKILNGSSNLKCNTIDLILAFEIFEYLFLKSISILRKSSPKTYIDNLFDAMPLDFSRKEAIEIGEKGGIPERTMDKYLSVWTLSQKLYKPRNGQYYKTNPAKSGDKKGGSDED